MKIYSVLLIVYSLTTNIFSQVQFTQHTITDSAYVAMSVYAEDVDGDGDMDVLSASDGDDKISWYENDGDENFTTHTITDSADRPWFVYAEDVDGDGDMDVLSASWQDDKIAWYENDGDENFTSHTITTGADGATTVYAEDVDDDGDMDVLSSSRFDNKIAWYENDGNENFTAHTITTSLVMAESVYAEDVDGDGDMDVLSASQVDDKIAWYENDGNENFTSHTITTDADAAWSVYAEDLDGDGDMDVLSASCVDDKIAWYENDGNENFTPHTITTNANYARSVYAIDIDGDGDVDVLSASWYDHKIAWYENDGNENFTEHIIPSSDNTFNSVYAVDVDDDGDIDVLSASLGDEIAWYENVFVFHLTVSINDGWNMVSIPGLHPTNQEVTTWWSGLTGSVFKFSGGYQVDTTATPSEGYWMKHTGANEYNTSDEWPAILVVPHDTISAAAGWNMIGGYEDRALTYGLTTTPPGLISGSVFGYSGGYNPVDTLIPGYGYWIKLIAAGGIIIPSPGPLSKGTTKIVEYFKDDWGKITITDNAGISYTLYAVKGEVDLDHYELPPPPPLGMFDIRYSSGRIAEDINSSIQTIEMSSLSYPITVTIEGMDIRVQDESGKDINENVKSGGEITISNAQINKLMVTGELIPDVYALEQNYPNPFNPSTVIEFSLPEDVDNVVLTIYDILGQKVTQLVNTSLKAGKYKYQWNAGIVATGMYIYELRADKFVSVKKMILLH